jgi:hypothetical protein
MQAESFEQPLQCLPTIRKPRKSDDAWHRHVPIDTIHVLVTHVVASSAFKPLVLHLALLVLCLLVPKDNASPLGNLHEANVEEKCKSNAMLGTLS